MLWLTSWLRREEGQDLTEYALLILEKAVLPPPPGIDLIHIGIDHMRIEFSPKPDHDNVKILQARYWLEEGEEYNLNVDDVSVDVGGVVTRIPAGSWKEKKGIYSFDSPKGVTPEVHMGTFCPPNISPIARATYTPPHLLTPLASV